MKESNKDNIIIKYIYENEGCNKTEMNQDLTHKYSRDGTQEIIRKEMSQKTLRNRLNWLLRMNHIIKIDGEHWLNKEKLALYPDIWNKRKIEFESYVKARGKFTEMLELYEDDDILKRAIKKHTKIDIMSKKDQNFYFSNEMHDLFNNFVYSLLIECFLNNPDHWHKLKKPEDLEFKININANWSKDPGILKKLNDRKIKCFKDSYLYPFGLSTFHKWGLENNEHNRKTRLVKKTEEDLFNKGFTEDRLRQEDIEISKQKIRRLKPVYLARIDKEYRDMISPEENKIALIKLREIIESEYIDFEEDVVLEWGEVGRPRFQNRFFFTLGKVIDLVIYDKDFKENSENYSKEEKWKKELKNITKYGDLKSKPIELDDDNIPEGTDRIELIFDLIRTKHPEKWKRIEESVDFEFNYHSIRNIQDNEDYFKA